MTKVSIDKCSGDDCPCKLRKKTVGEILSEMGVTMQEAFGNIQINFPKIFPVDPDIIAMKTLRDIQYGRARYRS